MAAAMVTLAIASAVEMAVLYHPGFDPTRVYEGTDTRAFGLLFGAALAMVWPTRDKAPLPSAAKWPLEAGGAAGLAVIGLLVWRTNQYSPFMFRGGLALLSLATVLVVAAVATPGSLLGRALGCGPLRWLGVRSYGIYLWHYPVIVLTAPALITGAMSMTRAMTTAVVSVAIAAVSWRYVEEPGRRGFNRGRQPRQHPRPDGWRFAASLTVGGLCLIAAAGVAGSVIALTARPTSGAANANTAANTRAAVPGSAGRGSDGRGSDGRGSAAAGRQGKASGRQGRETSARRPGRGVKTGRPGASTRAARGPQRTSCRSVVHMGDSTSDGLTSPDYLPNPADRITARYAAAGVTRSIMEISGGTSIVETLHGEPNEYTIARQLVAEGYHGCWVLALGTNDTADVYVGSNLGRTQRIKEMMSAIGGQPVLWVEVKSLVSRGPYAEQNMMLWNQALAEELPHYPNMRLYDWPAVVRDSWFISDGIHYSSPGYVQRARLIADALARAFPAS